MIVLLMRIKKNTVMFSRLLRQQHEDFLCGCHNSSYTIWKCGIEKQLF